MSATDHLELAQFRAHKQRHIEVLKARQHTEDLIIADYIETHSSSMSEALAFVTRFLNSERHTRYHWILKQWKDLLESKSPREIAAIFRDGVEATEELRSSAPFCGPALESL